MYTVQPLQIKSAVAVEGLKGYIYIEAYKQTHVKQVSRVKSTTPLDSVCVCMHTVCVSMCVHVGVRVCLSVCLYLCVTVCGTYIRVELLWCLQCTMCMQICCHIVIHTLRL